MRAIVIATGDADGLKPLTERTPVPLLPLVDRPLIQHVVEALAARKVTQIDFILSHLPEKIEEFIDDGARWGCKVSFHLARDPERPYRLLRVLDLRIGADETVLLGHADRLSGFPASWSTEPPTGARLLFWRESSNGDQPSRRQWVGWASLPGRALLTIPGDPDEAGLATHLFAEFAEETAWEEVPRPIRIHNFAEYFSAHEAILSKKSTVAVSPGKENEPGVWLGRNVSIHPSARITAPVYIGTNSVVGANVALGPYVVIGNDCMLDAQCTVAHSLIFPGSYVGEGLELDEVIVDRNTLINPRCEEAVTIQDAFILGALPELGVVPRLQTVLSRLTAALLLVLALPVLLLTALYLKASRSGPVLHRQKVIRLPASPNGPWRTFDLWSFRPDTGWHCSDVSLRGLLLQFLPALVNIARGEMSFVGMPPRTLQEVSELPPDWRTLYLRSKPGIVSDTSFFIGAACTDEERYSVEAFYSWVGDWRYDLKLLSRYFTRCLMGFLMRRYDAEAPELRAGARHFTHLLALPPAEQPRKNIAVVRDISMTGVGLETANHYEPGTCMTVELFNPRRQTSRTQTLVVRHVTPQANGKMLLGCQFVRQLSEEEFKELR